MRIFSPDTFLADEIKSSFNISQCILPFMFSSIMCKVSVRLSMGNRIDMTAVHCLLLLSLSGQLISSDILSLVWEKPCVVHNLLWVSTISILLDQFHWQSHCYGSEAFAIVMLIIFSQKASGSSFTLRMIATAKSSQPTRLL